MMQSCASAAKLRSGGPILPFGMKAKGLIGIPPPRTIIEPRHKRMDETRNCRGAFSVLRAFCWTQNDAVRYNALPHEPPQGDQKFGDRGRQSWLLIDKKRTSVHCIINRKRRPSSFRTNCLIRDSAQPMPRILGACAH